MENSIHAAPEAFLLESGQLPGADIQALLDSLMRFPNESFRALFWTFDEWGWVRVQNGKLAGALFSDLDGKQALKTLLSLPLCRYRVTRG